MDKEKIKAASILRENCAAWAIFRNGTIVSDPTNGHDDFAKEAKSILGMMGQFPLNNYVVKAVVPFKVEGWVIVTSNPYVIVYIHPSDSHYEWGDSQELLLAEAASRLQQDMREREIIYVRRDFAVVKKKEEEETETKEIAHSKYVFKIKNTIYYGDKLWKLKKKRYKSFPAKATDTL